MSFQYFFIKSRMNQKVMDIDGESRDPGTHVIMYEQKNKDNPMEAINQLWYEDPSSRSIRSALHDFALSLNGDNELIVEPFNGSSTQEWDRDGDKIRNRNDGQVVDISGENHDDGARMCKWSEHGGENQKWDFEYVEPRYFFIRSAMHGKVLDVSGANRDPGAEVIVWPKNDGHTDNQLWFTTGNNVVRSKLNGFALDSCDGDLKLYPCNEHSPSQGFRLEGNRIVNSHDGKAVDIAGECEDDGAHVCAWDQHGNANQQWEFEYIN